MKTENCQFAKTYSITDKLAIEQSIEQGINFLHCSQYPYGEFCSYYSSDPTMAEWCIPHSTIFPTALIVNSLKEVKEHPSVRTMFQKATGFFQYQTMRGGALNFISKWGQFFSVSPPDIDDTIFVSDFLHNQGAEYIEPTPILLENRAENGLFYTWFTFRFSSLKRLKKPNKNYWLLLLRELKKPFGTFIFWKRFECTRSDIDGVVNANMLHFLGKNHTTEPIIDFLLDILKKAKEADCDKWYRDPFTFYYFYSRNIKKGITELNPGNHYIKSRIIKRQKSNGQIGDSVLETAMSVIALMNIQYKGEEITKAIDHIIKHQASTGDWPRHVLYYSGPKKQIGWGSEELTTGFCIEALATYLEYNKQSRDEYQ